MTDACFLIQNKGLNKPKTCEECFAVSVCKMYANFKQLELTAEGYARLLKKEGF